MKLYNTFITMLTGSQYIARFLQKNNCNNIFKTPSGLWKHKKKVYKANYYYT